MIPLGNTVVEQTIPTRPDPQNLPGRSRALHAGPAVQHGSGREMLVGDRHHFLLGDRRKSRHRPQVIGRMGTLDR